MSGTVKKKNGLVIVGWFCLIIGIALMFYSLWTAFLYAPLFLVSFILAIILMSKKRVASGVILLLCSLVIPGILFFYLSLSRSAKAIDEAFDERLPSVEKAEAASIGSPVKTRALEILVSSAELLDHVGSGMFEGSPAEGGIYVAVQWEYKNISTAPIGMWKIPSIHLIDPNGVKYDADISASSSYSTDLELTAKMLSDLNPGIKVTSAAVFEVASELLKQPGWKLLIDADTDIQIDLTFDESPPSTEKAEEVDSTGSAFKTPTLEILVSSVEALDHVGSGISEESSAEGGTYVAVQWEYKNISKAPISMWKTPSIHLIDPNGVKYALDISASGTYSADLDLTAKTLSDLNPGIKVTSAAVFEVASELLTQPGWKILISADTDIQLDLTFGESLPST